MSKIFVDQVDPKTATTLTLGTTGDTVSIPSGVTIANSGTATGFGDATNFRPNVNPLIINGDMEVSQRGTSFASNGYGLDRWTMDESSDGAVTVTQDTDVPSGEGFAKSLKIDCTTADASIGAAQYAAMVMFFEGQNLQLLKYGTSSAENVTLSFWVKAVKTGTYCIRFVKHAGSGTRYETPIEYTISSASTWEKKVINLSPTAGSTSLITGVAGAIANNNSSGFRIGFTLAAGTDFHATNDTWVAGSDKMSTSNQVNGLDSTSNNFWLTGVQLEVGEYTSSTIPPFQHESYGDNLLRCQRYFFSLTSPAGYGRYASGGFFSTTQMDGIVSFPTTMRAAYSLGYSALGDFKLTSHTASAVCTAMALDDSNCLTTACVRATAGSGIATAGNYGLLLTYLVAAKLNFSSEL